MSGRRWAPFHTASRAALYCRMEKISVTFSVMPAAANSSNAPSPAAVAGTLIIRFTWPAAHFLPSSTYFLLPTSVGVGADLSSSSGSSSKLTYPLLPAVSSHTGLNTPWASLTKWSVSSQAISSSGLPVLTASAMWSLNAPALMMSATMIGLLVAPVAPAARFFFTSGGSIESSQTLVPVAISDLRDMGVRPFGG